MENLDGGFLGTALMLKFRKEIFLLQRSAPPQKIEQRIFEFVARVFRVLVSRFKLGEIGNQVAWRNN